MKKRNVKRFRTIVELKISCCDECPFYNYSVCHHPSTFGLHPDPDEISEDCPMTEVTPSLYEERYHERND